MGIANKYNKGSKFTFKVPETFKFESLADLYNNNGADVIYTVRTMWINKKSKFGEHPIISTSSELIGLPKHTTDMVKDMMRDDDVINAVNSEQLGFMITPYQDKNDVTRFSVMWVDI